MRAHWICLALGAGLVWAACARGEPDIRMRRETLDARRTACERKCDRDKKACQHQERKGAERVETSGPHEVSQDEWKKLYRKAQELARKCERDHGECIQGCID